MLFFLACAPAEAPADPIEVVSPSDTSSDSGGGSEDSATGPVDSADPGLDSGGDSGLDSGRPDTGASDTGEWLPAPDAVADWSLPDLNPGSRRFGEAISPRDYLSRVSGFYFVRAT